MLVFAGSQGHRSRGRGRAACRPRSLVPGHFAAPHSADAVGCRAEGAVPSQPRLSKLICKAGGVCHKFCCCLEALPSWPASKVRSWLAVRSLERASSLAGVPETLLRSSVPLFPCIFPLPCPH